MTFWISSDFNSLDKSVPAMMGWGRLKLDFSFDFSRQVPYRSFNFWIADSVQMQKRPTWPPGANFSKLSLLTETKSTPGMLRKALVKPESLP